MSNPIKIIVTEDLIKWRDIVKQELKQFNIEVIAEAGNGLELINLLASAKPDVILLDLSMPIMNGSQAMDWINKNRPDCKIIIMSLFDDPVLMNDYVLRDAKGCFPKTQVAGDFEELALAIKKVADGGTYFNYDRQAQLQELSIRQKEIINSLAKGKSQKQIAKELGVTINAVEKQKNKIMDILGVSGVSELMAKIFEKGLQFLRGPDQNLKKKKEN